MQLWEGFQPNLHCQLSKKTLPEQNSDGFRIGYIVRSSSLSGSLHRKKWAKALITTERINKRDQSLPKSPIGNAERSCPTDIKTVSQLVSFIGKAKGHAA